MITNPKFCPQCGTSLVSQVVADRTRPVCPACGFIFYLNPIVAAGTLIEQDGRVALVKRGVEPGRDRWGLPAGYVEADETAEEAAVRETLEETHLHVELDGLLDAFSFGRESDRGVLLIYAAHVLSGSLEAGDDALDAGWFGPNDLPEVAFSTHSEVLHQWRAARSVTYRRATLSDVEIVAMLAGTYDIEPIYDYARLIGDADWELVVATDNGQVIGFAALFGDGAGRVATVEQVFVHPRYRRWGIGTQLIVTCVSFARERGLMTVEVRVPVSNPGWTVYLKAGFRVSGFTNSHYPLHADQPETALFLTHDLGKSFEY